MKEEPPKVFGVEMVKSGYTVDLTYTTRVGGLKCIVARLGYQRWSWRVGGRDHFPYCKDEHEAATFIESELHLIRDGISEAIERQPS